MKRILTFAIFTLMSHGAFAAEPTAADVLAKVSARYRSMGTVLIEADMRISVSQRGQVAMGEAKTVLAVGEQGAFRVERNENGTSQVRVCDGKITWKALPNQKIWSKQEVAQEADPDDSDETPTQFQAQDLFTQARRTYITRYTSLEKYAAVTTIEKSERVKFNGSKVDCYVLRLATPGVVNRLYVAKDSFLVLRHSEADQRKTGPPVDVVTEYKNISTGLPPAEMFEFQPANGSREVEQISLPGERDVSLVGQRAADFTLKALTGEPVHLADLRGKIVMLDFWATWCQPCRHELPTIEALSRKYKEKNVVVLGINDEDASTARHFLEKNHPDLETLHDGGKKVSRTYGCNAIPTVVVINPEGTVVAHFVGSRSEDVLVAALKQAGLQ